MTLRHLFPLVFAALVVGCGPTSSSTSIPATSTPVVSAPPPPPPPPLPPSISGATEPSAVGAPSGGGTLVFDRPEKTLRAMRRSLNAADIDAMYACYTESGKFHDVGSAAVGLDAAVSLGLLPRKTEGAALLSKFGIEKGSAFAAASAAGDPKEQKHYDAMLEVGRRVTNPNQFLIEYLDFVKPRDEEGNLMDIKVKEPVIEKLIMSGDRATLHLKSMGFGQPPGRVILVNVGGSWLISNNPKDLVEGEPAEIIDEGGEPKWAGFDVRMVGASLDQANHILVLLHGDGANKDDLADVAAGLAEGTSLAVILPQGKHKVGEESYSYVPHDEATIKEEFFNTTDDLVKLLEEISTKHPKTKLSIGGFSQGGMFSLNLISKVHPKLESIILFAAPPLLLSQPNFLSQRVRILMVNGKEDLIVEFAGASELATDLKSKRFPVTMIAFEGGHEIPRDKMDDIRAFLLKE